jgi:small-conductance mechanosensitive channel
MERVWSSVAWTGSPLGSALAQGDVVAQLSTVLAAVTVAWVCVWLFERTAAGERQAHKVLLGTRHWDGVLWPAVLLLLLWLSRMILRQQNEVHVVNLALHFSLAWTVMAVAARVLSVAFHGAAWVRAVAAGVVALAWGGWALWAVGALGILLNELSAISWTLGGNTWTLRHVMEGAITTVMVLILALWLSSAVESKLLSNVSGSDLSLRKMLANSVRAVLVFLGLVLALNAVGIDLTALSVLGGAIGVGIGFGLQKLASNYVSGFVILGERSVRIGDTVRVDGFEGAVTDIRGRYTVLRAATGVESIVPNELLIIGRVENLSLADTRVWLSSAVTVGYDSDVDLVMTLLEEAAATEPRVMQDPPPRAALQSFGPDGLDFVLGFWIADLPNGRLNVTSAVNVAVLRALRAHRIDIPYPQRVLHWASEPGGTAEVGKERLSPPRGGTV